MIISEEALEDLAKYDIRLLKMFGAMPMFWGGDPQAMRLIESHGIDFYYLVALDEQVVASANTTKMVYTPTVMRIEHSFIGRSVALVDRQEVDLHTSVQAGQYYYTLPKMPYQFVQRVDAFFRKAHQVHGTEAILVLTFDPTALTTDDPGSGWGCIAPEQTNTSMRCDYQMDSVMQVKPEHVIIVGTWHSHPQMSAFFSGTDHQDQDGWDGIHLTTGWTGNNPSEYHISVISNGINYEYKPEAIFAPAPVPNVDLTGVDEWISQVSHAVVTTSSHGSYGYGTTGKSSHAVQSPYNSTNRRTPVIEMPPGSPDPRTNTIIAKLDFAGKKACPFCKSPIGKQAMAKRRCLACESFIVSATDSLPTLLAAREAAELPYLIDLDVERASKPIIMWNVEENVFSSDLRAVPDPK